MNNIFENAYFGKVYKTRDGRKARYCGKQYQLYQLELEGTIIDYFSDGTYSVSGLSKFDIVSEWQEEINEEELDRLANDYVGNYGCEHYDDGVEAYKAGYRKAKEL